MAALKKKQNEQPVKIKRTLEQPGEMQIGSLGRGEKHEKGDGNFFEKQKGR